MKLKALIIDDEIHIVKNLQVVLPWKEMGYNTVKTAVNGQEAIDIENKHGKLDLILCDIKMPVMDGLTFIKHLREQNKDCEVILLTGFQEFQYAQKAIQYRVREYILKPIDYIKLEDTIYRITKNIKHRKQQNMTQQKFDNITDLAYEKVFYDVIMNYSSHSLSFNEEINVLQSKQFNFFLIDIEDYFKKSMEWSQNEKKLWNFAVKNVLHETLIEFVEKPIVLQTRDGEWCVILERDSEKLFQREEMLELTEDLQNMVNKYLKLKINMVVWDKTVSMRSLSETYKKLQSVLVLKSNKHYSDKENQFDSVSDFSLWNTLKELITGLKQSDRGKVDVSLKQIVKEIKVITENSYQTAQQVLHFMFLHLIREMNELEIITSQEEQKYWVMLQHSSSVNDLLKAMNELNTFCLDKICSKKSSDVMMISAGDYIQHHISSDLSIDELSDYLKISPSYFSLLFKQHFQMTFVEYVTKQRLDLAKSLLIMTDNSITKIGKMIGYSERRYFTKVFQKNEGISPSEYRTMFNKITE
ncbi:response regulator transcription factor [Chengkuizengella sediminis]|uniref:response regulator transcription factor n=1 Tax=Chengkuizengella sediminis TaxID=1885917 RepID=UPI00138A5677|nr:response regulator [Chengkuizengella sediminis]NDI34186.1 response regulator [Chengkuizengella sediminis]